MQITYKFRLYPKKEDEKKLLSVLEICRLLYNSFLAIWNDSEKIPSRYKLQAMLKKNGRKVGKLRYKKYGNFKSFILNQSGFKVTKTGNRLDKLRISKVGDIPIRIHREMEGKIKQVIIKRYKSGEWYALISVDKKISAITRTIEKVIGLDMGIKFFLSDSDGRQIENPKLHQRLANQRDDFLHKLSRFYVDNYDLIAIEDLNIKGMAKNHWLAQSILDASWSKFFGMLSYKAESAGKIVGDVNPRGTSKEYKYGTELDMDYNASLNILERGMVGQGLPFVPSEVEPLRELIPISASSIVEVGSPLR